MKRSSTPVFGVWGMQPGDTGNGIRDEFEGRGHSAGSETSNT